MNQSKIQVKVETPDGFTVQPEKISEMGAPPFTRLGVVLNKPVLTAKVVMTFVPVPKG